MINDIFRFLTVQPPQRVDVSRAEALILYSMGLKPLEIAMAQGVHPNTVYTDLHAVGSPYGRWSLRKLSVYLVKQHIVKSIGHERLRQLLKERCTFPAGVTPGAAAPPKNTWALLPARQL